jgi:hypothetical protein
MSRLRRRTSAIGASRKCRPPRATTATRRGLLRIAREPTTPPGTVQDLTFDPDFSGFGETTVGTVTLVPPAQPHAVTVALSCDEPGPRFGTPFGDCPRRANRGVVHRASFTTPVAYNLLPSAANVANTNPDGCDILIRVQF